MKRKSQPREERRRPLAEINLLDANKRIPVSRKGCLGRFGSLLMLGAAAAQIALALVTAIRH